MPLSIAYLLARSTDTIADTELISIERRREALLHLRGALLDACDARTFAAPDFGDLAEANSATSSERELLMNSAKVLRFLSALPADDRALIRDVLKTIVRGQELDLIRFVDAFSNKIISLATDAEFDDYTYCVAGCVGKFWTKICRLHLLPKTFLKNELLEDNGIRFGKGLQLVNILRDLPQDLGQGRCYIPSDRLSAIGLSPQDLLDPKNMAGFRPLYNDYLQLAEDHLTAGWQYIRMLPFRHIRIRLACSWPILIGIKTLARLKTENVLDRDRRVKISRSEIRKLILRSLIIYPFPWIWTNLFYSEIK
jgi:farnesyl-diphosphate farnesyltransferase